MVETIGTDGGMQTFLDAMTSHYVRVCNLVLAVSQTKTPDEVMIEIDEAQFEIEETVAPKLFVSAWNESVKSVHGAEITTFVEREWRWIFYPLIAACRQAFATVLRVQFDDLNVADQDHVYCGDIEDSRHRYYCVGVVWRSVLKHFANRSRIKSAVESLFLSKEEASRLKLPVQEVNARTFKSLLYVNQATLQHFSSLCDKYREVCYWNGRLCVKDPMVLRRKTTEILADKFLLDKFRNCTEFEPKDVVTVYEKYVYRVETLIGHDVARQYVDLLTKSKDGVLERLRDVKTKKAVVIKAGTKRKRKPNRHDDFCY